MPGAAVSFPENLFRSLEEDRESGSRELLERLVDGLLRGLDESPSMDPETAAALPRRMADLRPAMAGFTNAAALLHRELEAASPDEHPRVLRDGLESLRERLAGSIPRIVEALDRPGADDQCVMTFSRSGTVLGVLRERVPLKRLVVLHSHPGGEGVAVARELADDAEVTFAYDAEAGAHFEHVDALYLGADALGTDGTVLNKTGSRLLARAARDVPVRVLTDSLKIEPGRVDRNGPTVPSPEDLPPALAHRHPLFERVPPGRVDTYVTDRGVAEAPDALPGLVEDLLRARRRFDDARG